MLNFKTTSSSSPLRVTANIAAGAMLWSTGEITVPSYDSVSVEDIHRDLLSRFYQGRSGDTQWKPFEFKQPHTTQEHAYVDVIEPSSMVNTILSSLGLGMIDLERVLRVKRATVYNWRKGGEIRDEASMQRLRDVYSIAKELANFNERPFGKRAKTHLIGGKSYLDLLSEDTFDCEAIISHAKVLSKQENARLKAKTEANLKANDIDNLSGGWQRV